MEQPGTKLFENDQLRHAFETDGEDVVRAALESGHYSSQATAARLWLRERELEREEAKALEAQRVAERTFEIAERSVGAAERSAVASERAAKASENSALYTRAAAWASAIAAIVALGAAILGK